MRYPKQVPVWEFSPGRKLAQITVRLKNVKGALAQASRTVAEMEVNTLSGFTTAVSASAEGVWSFFADVTDPKADLNELKERLLALPVVAGVEMSSSKTGFIIDRQNFPVTFSNRRALVMRTDELTAMFSHIWDLFGSGAATIIDAMAESMGRNTAREIIEDVGREFALQSIEEILGTYSALGYADLTVRRSDRGSMTIHAKELFECEANAKNNIRRKSLFLKGHLRGLLGTLFGGDFEVAELQCVAEGDAECSFNVARTESLSPRVALRPRTEA